jgi:hypothetical protein
MVGFTFFLPIDNAQELLPVVKAPPDNPSVWDFSGGHNGSTKQEK